MKLSFGSQQVVVTKGAKIKIRSDGQFMAYEQSPNSDGELETTSIYGPRSSNDRFTVFVCETGFMEIIALDNTMWGYDEIPHSKHEDNDTTLIELTADQQAPLTLKEEMKRFIVGEMSRVAESQDDGNFEDEDDFEMEDDFPSSPYELTEMQEEYLEPPEETPPEQPQAPVTPITEPNEGNPTTPTPPTPSEAQ